MSEVSTAIERLPAIAQSQIVARISTPDDDEIRRLYRIAEALAASGVYKDARQAGQAFAKIIMGRDLGLTPARAMAGLHFVEGQVQVHYRTLGAFVRSNGYEYRFGTGDPDGMDEARVIEQAGMRFQPITPTNDSVTLAFFGPLDAEGRRSWLGDSKFDNADMELAELGGQTSGGKNTNHVKYPRNMKTARAMSNGVGFYCPEVLGGIPVYVEDEIPDARVELTAGSGTGDAPGIDLGPGVEKIMERARALGHAGIGDRATVEMTLGKRGPDVWREWQRWATEELDRIDPAKQRGPVAEPDAAEHDPPEDEGRPADAVGDVEQGEVQPEPETPTDEPETHEEVVDAEPVEEDPVDDPEPTEAQLAMMDRREQLFRDSERDDLTDQQRQDIDAEITHITAQLAADADPEQGSLGF